MAYFIKSDNIPNVRLAKKVVQINQSIDFKVGDMVVVNFRKGYLTYGFEGICMSIKNKSLGTPNVSFLLRNIILKVGVEFLLSYFYNRLYFLTLSDYKRKKQGRYRKSKLYYIRTRVNRASRV